MKLEAYEVMAFTSNFDLRDLVTSKVGQGH